jgi:hypothetical protein
MFAAETVGDGIAVQVAGLTISGEDAANYSLSQPTAMANIISPQTIIFNPHVDGHTFTISLQTQSGLTYSLESKDRLGGPTWSPVQAVAGNGTAMILTDENATSSARFYRIRIH